MNAPISRRGFLKGAAASAALAGAHVLGVASRAEAAANPLGPVLVLVNLAGGNDFLNTVIPLDDAGAPQRSRYESLRPDLAVPRSLLSGLAVARAPGLGTGLALHPSLAELHSLYGRGRVALVLGAGIAGSSLSHFEAEKAWFFGRPDILVKPTGWVGRLLDAGVDGLPHAVSFGGEVSPTFDAVRAEALGVASLARFTLPDDPLWQWRDGLERGEALRGLLSQPRTGIAAKLARSGRLLIDQADFLAGIETRGWGSRLEGDTFGLGSELREIVSILRHDQLNPAAASGFRCFHARLRGFDTHTAQSSTDESFGQPELLAQLSRCLLGFQEDLQAIGVSHRVITLIYSEFGRRAAQNGTGRQAGSDHGAAGGMILVGDRVVGGVHGVMPRLDRLDAHGNLQVTTDFRTVYAALIDHFLGGDHRTVLPGGPFAPLPVIR
jgi:uncharacterized protein (DUF1501 family)